MTLHVQPRRDWARTPVPCAAPIRRCARSLAVHAPVEEQIPPGLEGDYDWSKFGLGEMLVFEKYPESTFAETLEFARRWGLDKNVRADTYMELAAPVSL